MTSECQNEKKNFREDSNLIRNTTLMNGNKHGIFLIYEHGRYSVIEKNDKLNIAY